MVDFFADNICYDFSAMETLLVEPNSEISLPTKEILQGFGVQSLAIADNTDDALIILQGSDIGMIITTWDVQPLDGYEFVLRVRSSKALGKRFVPILMLTAKSEMWRVIRARDAGVNDFVVLPLIPEILLTHVQSLVLKSRPFVETKGYFGPDRRRHQEPYGGPERRQATGPVRVKAGSPSIQNDDKFLGPPPAKA